jgi:integrator complex subunit 7
MKAKEVAQILRYASIYFLGFLIPTSTGNNFFILRFQPHRTTTDLDAFIALDLEERLESSCRFIASHEFGEFDVCSDADRETAFLSFLRNGLAPLLAGRPAHEQEIDIFHVFAMSIAPSTSAAMIPETAVTLNKPSWTRAQRLMKSTYAHSFQLHYSHRILLVKILGECLVLPETESDSISCPLVDGAISHLRASLHSFALGAKSPQDSNLAHHVLVNIAAQTGLEVCVNEEWDILLGRALANPRTCKCAERGFCTHANNGRLLERFIEGYNGSRHYADELFTRKALCDLSASIQQQVKLCQDKENFNFFHTCRLASLLRATKPLFYFLLTSPGEDTEETKAKEVERAMKATIIKASIQLIQYPDTAISSSASDLLALALAYGPVTETNIFVKPVLESIKVAFDQSFASKANEELGRNLSASCVVASRRSGAFAFSLLGFLITKRKDSWKSEDKSLDFKFANAVSKLIAFTSLVQPTATMKRADEILSLFNFEQSVAAKQHLAAAILSTRRAYFFAEDMADTKYLHRIKSLLHHLEPWAAYKMGRHALVTGNFDIASVIYERLSADVLSEKTFLWMFSLSKISAAEAALLKYGAKGIVESSSLLESGISSLGSLTHACVSGTNYSFHIEFLRLRIDFLDLVSVVRQASQEARFTGGIPKVSTRTGLHLLNAVKCFSALASRYFSIYRQYGLFMCQESRSCLRTLHALCRYLSKTCNAFFSELSPSLLTPPSDEEAGLWPNGDQTQSLTQLLRKFDEVIVNVVDKSIDATLRAKAITDILEGILKVPIPFPRSFLASKSIPKSHLQLSVDMDRCDDLPKPASLLVEDINCDENDEQMESVSVYPGTPIPILACGQITQSLHTIANVSFSDLLIWTRFRSVAPLHTTDFSGQDDEAHPDELNSLGTPESVQIDVCPPFSCRIPPSGRFVLPIECQALRTEGIYRLDIQLGCRDVRCGEWILPVQSNKRHSLIVKVSRSRG